MNVEFSILFSPEIKFKSNDRISSTQTEDEKRKLTIEEYLNSMVCVIIYSSIHCAVPQPHKYELVFHNNCVHMYVAVDARNNA